MADDANAKSERKPKAQPRVAAAAPEEPTSRAYLSQTEVPGYSLEQALRVARSIADNYGYKPTRPMQVAKGMGIQPKSGSFRGLTGASIAYGLTDGGAKAAEISLTPLGLRIVRTTVEGDDRLARREALLRPRVVREFLERYDGAPLPSEAIGRNVLVEMGVPISRSEEAYALIVEGAEKEGFLSEIKGRQYVDLGAAVVAAGETPSEAEEDAPESDDFEAEDMPRGERPAVIRTHEHDVSRRVFITHGKNKAFVDPIRKLLGFGEMEAVVAVDRTSVAQPVPDKVMGEMRGCGAAIIHVDAEQRLLDKDAKEHVVLNPNVLIEIGAAMALYGRRFILLVREGIDLPSNLQGLFQVRYSGEALDGEATIRLLEAINDIKNHAVPSRYEDEEGREPGASA